MKVKESTFDILSIYIIQTAVHIKKKTTIIVLTYNTVIVLGLVNSTTDLKAKNRFFFFFFFVKISCHNSNFYEMLIRIWIFPIKPTYLKILLSMEHFLINPTRILRFGRFCAFSIWIDTAYRQNFCPSGEPIFSDARWQISHNFKLIGLCPKNHNWWFPKTLKLHTWCDIVVEGESSSAEICFYARSGFTQFHTELWPKIKSKNRKPV